MMMTPRKTAQDGRVLILVLIFMLTLSAFWIIALSMTGSELSFVGGRRATGQVLFEAEDKASLIIDDFTAHRPTLPVSNPVDPNDFEDADTKIKTHVEVRPVLNDATYAANYKLPQQEHETVPPEGSGCGVGTCVAQRYVVTSEARRLGVQATVQVGVYLLVPK